MDLKIFIKTVRKITITEAASELGYTREHLTDVCNGRVSGGKNLGIKVEEWSSGVVKAHEVCFPKSTDKADAA